MRSITHTQYTVLCSVNGGPEEEVLTTWNLEEAYNREWGLRMDSRAGWKIDAWVDRDFIEEDCDE